MTVFIGLMDHPMCGQCLQIAAFTLLQSVLMMAIESFLCHALAV
jgi:hypothetical protein